MPTLKHWQELRGLLKRNRRELTDSIQNWIKQENDNASTNWKTFAYNNVTRAVTKACFTNYKGNMPLSKMKFRDSINEEEAYMLTRMEVLAAEIIWDIDSRFPDSDAKEKYQLLAQRLQIIGEAIGRMHSATIEKCF